MSSERDLEALYPFLRAEREAPAQLDDALMHSVSEKARESRESNERFFAGQTPLLIAAARALANVYRSGGRLFTMGNGGSGCDAAHVSVEFLHPVTAGRPALAAVNLAADVAMLSAVGNDVGFEHVFVRQLLAHARAGDAVIGISTSGNSANLLAAFAKAKELGLVTIGFSGGDGGRMKRSRDVDYCLVVPSSSIHRIQECHVTAYHILWDLVHTLLADKRGRTP
jgi:D-sedoheptulose 7-phosphate isomerase